MNFVVRKMFCWNFVWKRENSPALESIQENRMEKQETIFVVYV